jgi:hypothetical protein
LAGPQLLKVWAMMRRPSMWAVAGGVLVGVAVLVGTGVGVLVGVDVLVGNGVLVLVGVGVDVAVAVGGTTVGAGILVSAGVVAACMTGSDAGGVVASGSQSWSGICACTRLGNICASEGSDQAVTNNNVRPAKIRLGLRKPITFFCAPILLSFEYDRAGSRHSYHFLL